jgi:hypothetical protein
MPWEWLPQVAGGYQNRGHRERRQWFLGEVEDRWGDWETDWDHQQWEERKRGDRRSHIRDVKRYGQ